MSRAEGLTSYAWLQFQSLGSKFIESGVEALGLEEAGAVNYCLIGAEFGKMKGSGTRGEGCTTLNAFTARQVMLLVVWVWAGSCPGFWLNPSPTQTCQRSW